MLNKILSHLQQMEIPSVEAREQFLKRCVLSASGLRFIHSGDEEDESQWVCDEALTFVATCIHRFGILLKEEGGSKIWLGHDARPTGPLFMGLGRLLFKAMGIDSRSMGLGPIPEVMAATHRSGSDGFCYFTASHNPKGHNGLKLGLGDGAVLNKAKVQPFIDALRAAYLDAESKDLKALFASLAPVEETLEKESSRRLYSDFALETVCPEAPQTFLEQLSKAWDPETRPLFVIDMNGSSRLTTVDVEFLERAGIEVELMGSEPGVLHHAIIPEGSSLIPLTQRVQEHLDAGRCVLGGMAPDCDGDRGNMILVVEGRAKALKAQETFALCAVAEVSTRRALGEKRPMALAANGPSSLRLEKILAPYQVEVHRAEVGEANVLALASGLRERGLFVPMAGEGSNGGNILHPSTVRDPLMSLLSLLKFIAYPLESTASSSTLTSAQMFLGDAANQDPTSHLEAVLAQLPTWTSTDAFEGDALMPVPAIDHDVLKSRYEAILQTHFQEHPDFWTSMGVAKLAFFSNEGTLNIPGPGHRPAPAKGGLQVFMENASGERLGYLWMRGSGTEPVFRVMVDWGGDQGFYPELLKLHRSWIEASGQS